MQHIRNLLGVLRRNPTGASPLGLLQDSVKRMQLAVEMAKQFEAFVYYLNRPDQDGEVWTKVVDGDEVAIVPPSSE